VVFQDCGAVAVGVDLSGLYVHIPTKTGLLKTGFANSGRVRERRTSSAQLGNLSLQPFMQLHDRAPPLLSRH
jgi:hypothetical protein